MASDPKESRTRITSTDHVKATSRSPSPAGRQQKTPAEISLDGAITEQARAAMRQFAIDTNSRGLSKVVKEFEILKAEVVELEHQSFDENIAKNRYENIYCYDHTRVKLTWPPNSNSDYIHANWMKSLRTAQHVTDEKKGAFLVSEMRVHNTHLIQVRYDLLVVMIQTLIHRHLKLPLEVDHEFTLDHFYALFHSDVSFLERGVICTQGPLLETVEDFWRMVWQEKCAAIIMLCSVLENGKPKCEQYWPLVAGAMMKTSCLQITNEEVEAIGPDIVRTKLELRNILADAKKEKLVVRHILWNGWPDRAVPLTTTGALKLLARTQGLSPLVVHCSAGIGRTGTVVAIDVCLRTLLSGNTLNVSKVVREIRASRYSSCQTVLQYAYVYRTVLSFLVNKDACTVSEIDGFLKQYEAMLNKHLEKAKRIQEGQLESPELAPPCKRVEEAVNLKRHPDTPKIRCAADVVKPETPPGGLRVKTPSKECDEAEKLDKAGTPLKAVKMHGSEGVVQPDEEVQVRKSKSAAELGQQGLPKRSKELNKES